MGVCCSYESYTERPAEVAVLRGDDAASSDPFTDQSLISSLCSELEARASESAKLVRAHPLATKEREILNESPEFSARAMQIYAEFAPFNDGYKLQKYHYSIPFPFTPELYFLLQANMTEEILKEIDDNIDRYSRVGGAERASQLLSVTLTKSKKILIIEGRSFVVLKNIRRDKDGQLSEFMQSVSHCSLGETPLFRDLQSEQNNLGSIEEGGAVVLPDGDAFVIKSYNYVNPLSGVGIVMVKPVIKKSIKAHFSKLVALLAKKLMTDEKLSGFKWFNNDEEEIKRIYVDNLRRMKHPDFKFKFTPSQIDERIRKLEGGPAVLSQPFAPQIQEIKEEKEKIPSKKESEKKEDEKVPSRKESEKKEEAKVEEEKIPSRKESEKKEEEKIPSRKESEKKEEEKIPSRKESEKKEEVKVEDEKIPSRKESEKKEEAKVEEEKIPSRKESEKKEEEKIPSRKESEKKEEEKIPSRKKSEKKEEEKIASRKESEKKEEEKIPSRKESEKKEEEEKMPSRKESEKKEEEKIPSRKESEKKEEENESDLKETEANSEVVEGSSVSVPFTADSEIIRASEPAQENESEAGASQEEKPSETFERQKTKKNKRKN